jgi:hypothetical protein
VGAARDASALGLSAVAGVCFDAGGCSYRGTSE